MAYIRLVPYNEQTTNIEPYIAFLEIYGGGRITSATFDMLRRGQIVLAEAKTDTGGHTIGIAGFVFNGRNNAVSHAFIAVKPCDRQIGVAKQLGQKLIEIVGAIGGIVETRVEVHNTASIALQRALGLVEYTRVERGIEPGREITQIIFRRGANEPNRTTRAVSTGTITRTNATPTPTPVTSRPRQVENNQTYPSKSNVRNPGGA